MFKLIHPGIERIRGKRNKSIENSYYRNFALHTCHLPWDRNNPYQKQLALGLNKIGFDVVRGGKSVWILKTLRPLGRRDIAHFHWLEFIITANSRWKTAVKSILFVIQIWCLAATGRRIFWTVHNLIGHDSRFPRIEKWVTRQIARRAECIVAHCGYAKQQVALQYGVPPDKIHVIPHGNYIGAYPDTVSRKDARARFKLKENDLTLLFVGNLRPYKGVESLITAFSEIDDPSLKLLIAGRCISNDELDALQKQVRMDSRVQMYEGYIQDDDMQWFLNACDAVVLPFRKILTSGSLIMAMSFGRVSVVPPVGCMTEMSSRGGIRIINTTLRDAIEELRRDVNELSSEGLAAKKVAQRWGWDKIARRLARLYVLRS